MEVYIGGRAQGKLAFVREKYPQKTKIADGKYAAQEECLRAEIIDHFHLYLGRFGADAAAALRSAAALCRWKKATGITGKTWAGSCAG